MFQLTGLYCMNGWGGRSSEGATGAEGGGVLIEFEGDSVRAAVAETFLDRLRGLRFRESGAMLFRFETPTRATVDSLFVRDELALYFFDRDRRLVDSERLMPYRLYRPTSQYRYLLESFEPLDIPEHARLPAVSATG
jgi:uncharacterized membrane protein (UPF0127 family)